MAQEEAPRLSGFEYNYYQRVECGEKNLPLTSLNKLAKAFKTTIAELVRVQREPIINSRAAVSV